MNQLNALSNCVEYYADEYYLTFGIAVGDANGDGDIAPVDQHGLPNINILGLLPDIYV